MEIIMIIAVILGPILAVLVSQYNDKRRQSRVGKEVVFKTLMKTRSFSLSTPHVEALNMIDVEFYGNDKKNKSVVSAWKLYLDSLADKETSDDIINARRRDLFNELLFKMAEALGYDFDKEHIKNAHYIPQLYADTDNEQLAIRKGVLSIIKGDFALPIHVTNVPFEQHTEPVEQQQT